MGEGQWYYCLDHKAVEPYFGCRSATRLGPYASREEAQEALERVAERNDEWETDPRYHDAEEEAEQPDDTEGWGPFRH